MIVKHVRLADHPCLRQVMPLLKWSSTGLDGDAHAASRPQSRVVSHRLARLTHGAKPVPWNARAAALPADFNVPGRTPAASTAAAGSSASTNSRDGSARGCAIASHASASTLAGR